MSGFIAFEGNLTADPELHTFDDGNVALRFRLLDNPSHVDRRTGEWVNDTPVGMNCNARDDIARNIAATASKGDRLVVWGTKKAREYTDNNTGQRRTTEYLAIDAAGSSLRYLKNNSPTEGATPAAPPADDNGGWPEVSQPGSAG